MLRELRHVGGVQHPPLLDHFPRVLERYKDIEIVRIHSVSRLRENLSRAQECPARLCLCCRDDKEVPGECGQQRKVGRVVLHQFGGLAWMAISPFTSTFAVSWRR